jgi:hypothetical protein
VSGAGGDITGATTRTGGNGSVNIGSGLAYGGTNYVGGSGAYRDNGYAGFSGAVRIIWGSGRSFPSTNTGDV